MTKTFSLSETIKLLPGQIENICLCRPTHSELIQFIHFCKSMTMAFLHNKKARPKSFFPIINGSDKDFEDIALDIIATLFHRSPKGRFLHFEHFFNPLLDSIRSNPDEAYIHLKRLISSHLDQELATLLSKEDPDGWKLYRNLVLASRRNPVIHLIDIQYNRYIIYSQEANPDPCEIVDGNLPEIGLTELETILYPAIKKYKTTPAYLEHVLKTLRDHKRLAAQVALSTMYQAMKNILGITTVTLDEENPHLAQDDLPISREDLLAQIKRHIGDQLESVYKKTGKAPETVLSRYRSILNTYFEDLIWLGHTASLVKYMNHKPANEILKPEWDKHKGRLEYLIKKGRKHLQLIFRQN